MGCSRGIIRNRASILSLLASLSEASASSSSSSRQKTEAFPSLNLSSQNLAVTLRPSSRTGSTASSNLSGVSGFHPPLPPKPRSRPSSQHLDQADGEGRGSVDRETVLTSGRGSANLRPKGQWPQQGCNVREEELVRELVYVFQGIQGSLITLDSRLEFPAPASSAWEGS